MPATRSSNRPKKAKVEETFTYGKYLELKEDGKDQAKFWEIKQNGTTTYVRYGKEGKQGTRQTKEHDSEVTAKKFALKSIRDKKKKGYAVTKDLVTGATGADADDIPAAPAKEPKAQKKQPAAKKANGRKPKQQKKTSEEDKVASEEEGSPATEDGTSDTEPAAAVVDGDAAAKSDEAATDDDGAVDGDADGTAETGEKHYYELTDDKSSKFWEVRLDAKTVYVRYGKVGKSGTKNSKTHDSAEAARKAMEKLIKEKTKKGYEEKA
ncbi:hypothetical protein PTSG_07067 [Salpingoeca rosetta]|uniref:WGR domain-containing protein n=1 Tax=Salpingoeca rosetta (strain ATCC 50818 / BSB-021) TaxID=946362 RepID=F2UDY7_SALR5|nr:uncharacterized protein PTSG_07067 [Salpingoeca rosetta]EGD74837.1 hypothetical protein PTSG_07067 [Salpingoeca rosetta]|eukprot:XP_004992482.1 hypothetical protein PTSG_07067 [Salpingoeca rosetta]